MTEKQIQYHRGAMFMEIEPTGSGLWNVGLLHKPSGNYLAGWTVTHNPDYCIIDALWRNFYRRIGAE